MYTVFNSVMLVATTAPYLTRLDRLTGEWICGCLVITTHVPPLRQRTFCSRFHCKDPVQNIPSGEILLRFRRDMNYCPPSGEIGSMCTFKVWIEAMIIVCFIQFLSFLLCVHAFGFLSVGPSISPGQFNVTVTAGMRAVLSCETTGIPPPKVSWKRNGKPLDASQLSGAFRCLSIYKDLIYVRA